MCHGGWPSRRAAQAAGATHDWCRPSTIAAFTGGSDADHLSAVGASCQHLAGMPKRKAGEAGLPATIRQEPASTSGSGPFVVYFPSAFEPNGSIPCEWQTYAHSERKNQYVVVAKTVGGRR